MVATFVGIDIGGTHTRLAIVDALGRVLADRHTETPTGGDGEDLIRWLENAYHVCRGETDNQSGPAAVGVGVPGILEPGRSAVVRAVNLPFIEGLPLRDMIVERTGTVTVLDCDTVAAAWGEFCARERSPKRFAYVTIGTGVGAAVILDAKVVRHTHHSAGHFGHLICDASEDAPECHCGARGCLEAIIGGPALAKAARSANLDADINDIERAFHEGDREAASFINTAAKPLAVALLDLAHSYATDTVVIGGGVVDRMPSLAHTAGKLVEDSAGTLKPDGLRIELSALGAYSGVVGAALLAAEHIRDRSRK